MAADDETAMGAIETIQGSEYGLATRALCCEALERAGSPQAREMSERAASYARKLTETIRDPELREMFKGRRYAAALLGAARGPSPSRPSRASGDPPSKPAKSDEESVRPGGDRGSLSSQ